MTVYVIWQTDEMSAAYEDETDSFWITRSTDENYGYWYEVAVVDRKEFKALAKYIANDEWFEFVDSIDPNELE